MKEMSERSTLVRLSHDQLKYLRDLVNDQSGGEDENPEMLAFIRKEITGLEIDASLERQNEFYRNHHRSKEGTANA